MTKAESYPQVIPTGADPQLTARLRRLMSWFPIVLVIVGIALLLVGLVDKYALSRYRQSKVVGETTEKATTDETITVDVSGAVEKPGVYVLAGGARVHDALLAAGGLTSNAARDYLSKYVNLAQKITDGQKIYIPLTDEKMTLKTPSGAGLIESLNPPNFLDLNTASRTELESLPGIGPVTAEKIIAGRPYRTLDELVGRKIIFGSLLEKIRGKVTVL